MDVFCTLTRVDGVSLLPNEIITWAEVAAAGSRHTSEAE